ncbi:hypothetical protein SAMN02745823_02129 [Sporobacter termitidis DSM 10068]|uniref:CAAX prenyl protease 2/Lysostaphin resistance protein A-like domain-containing protein n=1 Tax=Sporobacter termitidis DSM 10068 TaxID=1123282 RepID=A0A1M5Y146_9FIRM|nr:type II CAAX endopeptidase family protein [Sporobacter termitidis]SHI05686.1 hypothetical protein SAMN02745823_02129 [Sporobacter termitidis DSM 10068]
MTKRKKAGGVLDIAAVFLAVLAIVVAAPLLLSLVQDRTARALLRYLLYIVMAAVVLLACKAGKRPVFATLGFKKEAVGRQLLPALPLFAVTALIFVVIPMAFGVPKTVLLDRKPTDVSAIVLQVVHLMVFVGFTEELVFRGYLFERIKAVSGSGVWSAVVTAAAFGLWHFPGGQDFLQVLLTAVIGFIYGFARLKLKNCTTLSVALAHGLHDTFILVLSCILL